MVPVDASKLLIVDGVEDDPRMRARVERLRPGIVTDDVRRVGDAELAAIEDAIGTRKEILSRIEHEEGLFAKYQAEKAAAASRHLADGTQQAQRTLMRFTLPPKDPAAV